MILTSARPKDKTTGLSMSSLILQQHQHPVLCICFREVIIRRIAACCLLLVIYWFRLFFLLLKKWPICILLGGLSLQSDQEQKK